MENINKKSISIKTVLVSMVCALVFGYVGAYAAIKTVTPNVSSQQPPKDMVMQTPDASNALQVKNEDPLTIPQIAALAQPSVVEITTEKVMNSMFYQNYVTSGAGSGVIISEDGYIVTNNHVIEGATKVTVRTHDSEEYNATLVSADPRSDIAVIKVEANGLTAATLGNSDNLVVGETVVAIGNPLGNLGGSVSSGIVSALNREITIDNSTMTLLQITAAVSPGNSGGGLFNAKGELVGIVNAKSGDTQAEGIGFAIPINEVSHVSNDLMTVGYVTNRPSLGVMIADMQSMGGSFTYIAEVLDGGAAEKAGLQANDVVIAVDDLQIGNSQELIREIQNRNVGDTVKITVSRDKSILSFDVVLQETVQNKTNE